MSHGYDFSSESAIKFLEKMLYITLSFPARMKAKKASHKPFSRGLEIPWNADYAFLTAPRTCCVCDGQADHEVITLVTKPQPNGPQRAVSFVCESHLSYFKAICNAVGHMIAFTTPAGGIKEHA